jgi:hypothetical protein
MVHFANVGTSEEFIETFSGEILELVDGSLIFGEEREAVKNAIMTVVVASPRLLRPLPAGRPLRQPHPPTQHPPQLNERR